MIEKAFDGFVALPPPKSSWEILEIRPGANDAEIDAAYKRKAMSAHPDRGGSSAAMAELTEAAQAQGTRRIASRCS
ncbi:MAG: J domain-containing protein [Bryobacteraceae bacterium]